LQGLLPQLKESARVGPFTIMALLPYAQQYLADVKNTFRYYNDLALMVSERASKQASKHVRDELQVASRKSQVASAGRVER
jgi:hypothetical protein